MSYEIFDKFKLFSMKCANSLYEKYSNLATKEEIVQACLICLFENSIKPDKLITPQYLKIKFGFYIVDNIFEEKTGYKRRKREHLRPEFEDGFDFTSIPTKLDIREQIDSKFMIEQFKSFSKGSEGLIARLEEGCHASDISRELGLSASAVSDKLKRLRSKFKDNFKNNT